MDREGKEELEERKREIGIGRGSGTLGREKDGLQMILGVSQELRITYSHLWRHWKTPILRVESACQGKARSCFTTIHLGMYYVRSEVVGPELFVLRRVVHLDVGLSVTPLQSVHGAGLAGDLPLQYRAESIPGERVRYFPPPRKPDFLGLCDRRIL